MRLFLTLTKFDMEMEGVDRFFARVRPIVRETLWLPCGFIICCTTCLGLMTLAESVVRVRGHGWGGSAMRDAIPVNK